MFECHSRLLVVRVDLAYGNADKYHITADETLAHRDTLLETLHRKTLPWLQSLVGYAWRLEYGTQRRAHYHLLLFFNGAKARQDITLARRLGEHWQRHITEGKGTYYNCNQKKETYAKLGIGRIHYRDTDKRKVLVEVASYLTKPHSDASPHLPACTRSFGRGKRPRGSEPRGRKRQSVEATGSAAD
ncbi:YagK/YfjJ domain-containing protein [Serratia fonticola]